jgi:hypothetical protein
MQIIPIDSLVARAEHDHTSHLAIKTFIPASGHSIKSLGYENHKKALIISHDSIEYWESTAVREHNKELVILGPWLEPKALTTYSKLGSHQVLRFLKLLIRVFSVTKDLPDFQTNPVPGIITLQDGRLMVLPKSWSQGIIHHCSDHAIQRFQQVISFPGKNTDYIQTMGFTMGFLAYLWLTGVEPFSLDNLDQSSIAELNEQKRNGMYMPLGLHKKTVSKDFEKLVDALLLEPTIQAIDQLSRQVHSISSFSEDSKHPYRPEDIAKLEKKWNRTTKLFQLRRFVQKKRTLLIATSLAVILVLSVGTQMIQRALTPPLSLGWSPEQVVAEFFQAANNLDSVIMDQLVMNNGARELRRTVVHLFATSRVREAHEMRNPHINAQQWVTEGKPQVPDAAMIFGIVDFQVLEISPWDQGYKALVRYSLYMPDVQEIRTEDGLPGTLTSYMVEQIEEYIFLGKERDAWKIQLVERVL